MSDRIGRRTLIIGGWLIYALIYLGFALSKTVAHIFILYTLYGLYYGMAYGTTKALISDIIPAAYRGSAYGIYSCVLGISDLPASVIAGILWQGADQWRGFGPSAPFYFGAASAFLATTLMYFWRPKLDE